MLTRKQHELITFIQNRLEASGISPSFEEMKEALDLKSKSGVHRLISALEERSFIRRLPNRARALEVIKLPEIAAPAAKDKAAAARPTQWSIRRVGCRLGGLNIGRPTGRAGRAKLPAWWSRRARRSRRNRVPCWRGRTGHGGWRADARHR